MIRIPYLGKADKNTIHRHWIGRLAAPVVVSLQDFAAKVQLNIYECFATTESRVRRRLATLMLCTLSSGARLRV